jgi:DNA polymerase-1
MDIIKRTTGMSMVRKHVKIIGFGIMYGMGVDKLAASMGVTKDEGQQLRDAYYSALPEIRDLSLDTRNRGKRGEFIRTWGGRVYYREPNPDRDLSYKLLNYLIQGSSADQTKQSIIDYDKERGADEVLIAAVHDELNASVPVDSQQAGMVRLRSAMDKDRFDVPFKSEGYAGPNWADIEKYEPEEV